MSAGDFQDISPVTVCFETDKGALHALLDDPIILRADDIEADPSLFYLNAKLRGINALREARDGSLEFTSLLAASLLIFCENPDCNAEGGEPCVSEDGSTIVPVHKERLDGARAMIKAMGARYREAEVKIDGP